MSLYRPNWNRARALALEIETTRQALDDAKGDPEASQEAIADIREELHDLEREFFLTGAISEYDL